MKLNILNFNIKMVIYLIFYIISFNEFWFLVIVVESEDLIRIKFLISGEVGIRKRLYVVFYDMGDFGELKWY